MKALTLKQPWAWAVVLGGKDVENRTSLWKHRGPLAIHAGATLDQGGFYDPTLLAAAARLRAARGEPQANGILRGGFVANMTLPRGAIAGVVNLTGAHVEEDDCCESPWAQYAQHPGQRPVVHLTLADAQPLTFPVDVGGKQGLWDLPQDVEDAVRAQVDV